MARIHPGAKVLLHQGRRLGLAQPSAAGEEDAEVGAAQRGTPDGAEERDRDGLRAYLHYLQARSYRSHECAPCRWRWQRKARQRVGQGHFNAVNRAVRSNGAVSMQVDPEAVDLPPTGMRVSVAFDDREGE